MHPWVKRVPETGQSNLVYPALSFRSSMNEDNSPLKSESTAVLKFKAAAKLAKVRREKDCTRDRERESERDFLLRSCHCVCERPHARAYTVYRLYVYITCIHYNIVYMVSTYVIL